ncbi:hypothetical protein BJP62_05330 [Jeongeupia sp. USM3]|nr:hypothetical protein BJP62_05330 [Jeongeupia sp. USM3]
MHTGINPLAKTARRIATILATDRIEGKTQPLFMRADQMRTTFEQGRIVRQGHRTISPAHMAFGATEHWRKSDRRHGIEQAEEFDADWHAVKLAGFAAEFLQTPHKRPGLGRTTRKTVNKEFQLQNRRLVTRQPAHDALHRLIHCLFTILFKRFCYPLPILVVLVTHILHRRYQLTCVSDTHCILLVAQCQSHRINNSCQSP